MTSGLIRSSGYQLFQWLTGRCFTTICFFLLLMLQGQRLLPHRRSLKCRVKRFPGGYHGNRGDSGS